MIANNKTSKNVQNGTSIESQSYSVATLEEVLAISESIDRDYAEAFKMLAKGPNKTNDSENN